jgi:RNA polymerase subunit RPABC4/transcription elongation factor Spt4
METLKPYYEPHKLITEQLDTCPYCGKEILVCWNHVSVLTIDEYRAHVKQSLKALKEETRKEKRKA